MSSFPGNITKFKDLLCDSKMRTFLSRVRLKTHAGRDDLQRILAEVTQHWRAQGNSSGET